MFDKKPHVAKELIQSWPDGLIGLDHYGKITFCNQKSVSLLGWTSEQMLERSAHDLLCSKAADYAHVEDDCPMCLKAENSATVADHFEAWWVGANGIYMNLDVRVLEPEVTDLDIARVLMFSECASHRVSQFEARRLAMFAEFSPVPILEIAVPMSIEFANPAMTDLMVEYGFTDEGVPNVLPRDLEALVAETVKSGQMLLNQEVEYNDKCFVWSFKPQVKNRKSFVQVYGLDVTELRRVQYELEEAKNVAERASDAKSHFLANMSHEIRTPMNAIVGFTEILSRSTLNEKQLEYCNKIKISSSMLLDVINDILDFSKIEAGKMQLEKIHFNLIENIEVLADLFADRAFSAGVSLVFDIDQRVPASLLGDPLRLKQILINLVSNALKFTQTGYIEVIVKPVRQDGKDCRIRVEVKDTGKGIPKDKQAKLFAPFTQEDESTTRQFGGTGLGLSICRSLVEMMEGSIGVRSKEGQGSVFFFEANFGVADAVSVLDRQMEHFKVSDHQRVVLLLESDAVLRRSLRHQLRAYGLVVQEFEGAMALIDDSEWVERRDEILAIFCDDQQENIDWVETLANGMSAVDKRYPLLISLVPLSSNLRWSDSFNWPQDRSLTFERPIKPSIVGRSVLSRSRAVAADEVAVTIDAPAKVSLKNFRILIVDDNAFNRELALELLAETDAALVTAEDGKSAVAMATEQSFDFILMDIQMPVMDGFEATRKIKAKIPHQVVIALTANAIKGDRERFMEAGFDDYLSKPVDANKLYDMLYFWAEKLDKKPGVPEQAVAPAPIQVEKADRLTLSENPSMPPVAKTLDISRIPNEYRGIHVAKALKMVGNKTGLYFKLMIMFCENYQKTSDDLSKALQAQDIMTAGRLVHTIKGSASSLGAENLRRDAYNLEDAMINNAEKMQEFLNEFCMTLDETLLIMDDFVDKFKHLA